MIPVSTPMTPTDEKISGSCVTHPGFRPGSWTVMSFSYQARRYGDQASGRALYRSTLDLGPLNGTCTPIYIGCNEDGTPITKYLRLPALFTVNDTPC